jgi:hypothetical protein
MLNEQYTVIAVMQPRYKVPSDVIDHEAINRPENEEEKQMVEVEITFGVPEGIIPEVKKKFAGERDNNLRITKANPAFPPYYAFGDPRASHANIKFEGKEYWVWLVTPGRRP